MNPEAIDLDAKARPNSTQAEIVCFAIPMTASTWVIGTVMMAQIQGLTRAAIIAAVGILGGLILWTIHASLSRRTNGLAGFMIMALGTGVGQRDILPLKVVLTSQATAIVILSLVSSVFALLVRKPQKSDGQPTDSPLWDAEVDPPRLD